MVAMADNALWPAPLQRNSVSTGFIILPHSQMTSTTKSGYVIVLRSPEKTFIRVHSRTEIGRITTMAIVTRNTISGMDTRLPLSNWRTKKSLLATVALQTDRVIGHNWPTQNQ